MAGIKYQCEFYSNNGSRYRMNLYHVDYSGTTIPFKAGPEGFQLKYEGETDSVYQTIKASSLQFDFIVEEAPTSSGDPTTGNIYADLLANNENKMFVIVQQYDSDNTAWRNFWAGDIIDDTVVIEDSPYPFAIRIKATDGIAKLKQKIYTPSAGGSYLPILWYFQKAIEQTTYYSTLFPSSSGTSVVTLRNTADRYHENMGDITDGTWQNTYNPMKLVYVNEGAFVKQDGTYMTYYEILSQICTLWNCQFFLASIWNEDLGCTWWLFSRYVMYNEDSSSIETSCRIFKNQAYDSSNTALNYGEYSVPNTSVNSLPVTTKTIGDADHPKFSGNKITYLPPLGRIQVNYNHDLFAFSLNANLGDSTGWGLSANASYYNIVSSRVNATTGSQFFVGDYTEITPVEGGTLSSPVFPSGMDYTDAGNNNNGLFIPVTNGQDAISVTGTMTFQYKFSWSNALVDTMINQGAFPLSFNEQFYMYIQLSNKSFYDWNNAVTSGTNLGDNYKNIYLTGDFGNGGDGTSTWTDTGYVVPDTSMLRVYVDSLPIENGVEQTITVPFTFYSESIPTTWDSASYPYLKRMQFGLANFNDTNMFGSFIASMISGGVITCDFANVSFDDFHINYLFDSSEMSNYFSRERGLYVNSNTDASAQMEVAPDVFIGDPPQWISDSDGDLELGTSPAQYLGVLRIVAPSATDPTTTPPDQSQQNNRKWRSQQDGTVLPLHQLLYREIIKKRALPSYKYDISFENSEADETITFVNTLKIDMKLNSGESADLQGFFPVGGTYTAVTDSWKMVAEQLSINTETNLTNGSSNIFLVDWFIDNPNILMYTNL